MKQYKSSVVLQLAWVGLDATFDVATEPVFSGRPVFYWMFVGVFMVLSFGAFVELEHRLWLAGWEDPLVKAWRRIRSARKAASSPPTAVSHFAVSDEQIGRYRAFTDKIKAHYGADMDFDANIELEFSHFRDDGTLVVNAYPKTAMGHAMIGTVRARLEQQ